SPFFGEIPGLENVYAASGLGATGLTAGPLVGQSLASLLLDENVRLSPEDYPIAKYVKKIS
ncbi:MAG: FAD-dependent oxidoreductase, partial [Alkalibacterium gilvum]